MPTHRRAVGAIVLGVAALAASVRSDTARAADRVPDTVGAPASVEIAPKDSTLVGRRATRQLILTAHDANGSVRDLTRLVEWVSLDPAIAEVSAKGRVTPKGNGTATIVARKGSVEAKTTVVVSKMEAPAPVSFRHDVIPSLSQAGCNTGACHGTPTGKGGFRLSLRGYLPDQDYMTLSREAAGRRINPIDPDASAALQKPLGTIPHEEIGRAHV